MGAQQGGLARWRKDKDGGGGGGGGGAGAEGGAGESENKSAEGAARERGSSGGKGLPQLAVPEGMKKRNRRVSVSAEVDRDPNEKWVKKVIPKSEEAMKRISEAVSKIFLFSSLDREQLTDVVNAMEEKKVEAGETIIKQGAPGDNFYIIDSGRYEVFKQVGDEPQKKVFEYDNKGSFGELALMYNCPRAATVVAATPGVLWAVDRLTFRHIVVTATAEQRRKYEEFIERVELFKKLTHGERSLIADCLAPLDFDDGAYIIRQGEVGDRFFILERGVTVATQMVEGRGEVEVGRMQEGQFFGERALITNEPRAANVKAVGPVKVAVMERSAFERLLGDCREIMQRQIRQYRSAENILAEKDATAPAESPAAPQPPPEEAQKQNLDASAPTADAAAAAPPAPVEEEKDVETLEH